MLTKQREFTRAFVRTNETYIAGEPLSTFLLGERKRKRTTILRLRNEQDEILERSEDVERHMLQYYRQLYTRDPESEVERDAEFGCRRMIPENDEANEASMSEISTTEIYNAIKTSAAKRIFPEKFRHYPQRAQFNIERSNPVELPRRVRVQRDRTGEKKVSSDNAHSYRPISLINFDYKLLCRILKGRLERILREHRVLGDVQKCSNADHNIFEATLAIKDRIAQLIRTKQRAKLISFDFDHAFDRVNRDFLFNNMCSVGFKRRLVALLACFADYSAARLIVNGHLSESFPIERSVAQGNPLSSLTFAIYLLPLLNKLKRACGLDLVVAYADDITVVVTSVQKLENIYNIFRRF